jgi:UTP--glucose-1-phosphate uridylyltransferase
MYGVIVAAGYGTRFLPLTKTLPKEMLPLFDKPLIDFILDEFEEAGIKDVIIITSRRKKIMDDYLDREIELETVLKRDGKTAMLDSIKPRNLNYIFVRQQEMMGTGHALLLTRPIIGNNPFIVAYPDDIVLGKPGLSSQLKDLYEKTGNNVLAVREENENITRYGVIQPKVLNGFTYMEKIVEKPDKVNAPSNLVSVGRYLFTGEILELLEEGFKKHSTGEFYHIDAINRLASEGKVLAHKVQGTVLDTGEPNTYLESILTYIKSHPKGSRVLDAFVKNNYNC